MSNEQLTISLGGVVIGFYGCPPSARKEPLLLFAQEDAAPDIRLRITETENLPEPCNASVCYASKGFRMLADGTQRWALSSDPNRTAAPTHAVLRYDTAHPEGAELFFASKRMVLNVQSMLSSIMLETLLLRHARCILHASFILTEQGAILFSAPSGTGKSTQAELWRRYRHAEIINGDKAILRLTKKGAAACGLPFCGSSGICRNATAPLRAVVVLAQGAENRISRMGGKAAVKALLSQMYVRRGERESVAQAMTLASEIAVRVPVYHLSCLPERSAVECLEKALTEDQNNAGRTKAVTISPQ